jgi:Domain of unknown function (DUF778)
MDQKGPLLRRPPSDDGSSDDGGDGDTNIDNGNNEESIFGVGAVVWTPLPPLTWLLPMIGHAGIQVRPLSPLFAFLFSPQRCLCCF